MPEYNTECNKERLVGIYRRVRSQRYELELAVLQNGSREYRKRTQMFVRHEDKHINDSSFVSNKFKVYGICT